jgi:hypothetical protein
MRLAVGVADVGQGLFFVCKVFCDKVRETINYL